MSASDRFQHPTTRVHEMWQTDFRYFRIIGWRWYSLSTVLDDDSRYIIAWKLSPTMGATDVTKTLDRRWRSRASSRCASSTDRDFFMPNSPHRELNSTKF
jgi:transposase InsO family protein